MNYVNFLVEKEIIITFYFKNVINQKKDWEDVKVVTEIQERNSRLRFNIKASKQYPELASYEKVLEEKINAIINTNSLLIS